MQVLEVGDKADKWAHLAAGGSYRTRLTERERDEQGKGREVIPYALADWSHRGMHAWCAS